MQYTSIFLVCFQTILYAQCPTNLQILKEVRALRIDSILQSNDGITKLLNLQKKFDQCGLKHDSVYAQVLNNIGFLEFNKGRLNDAISHTLEAISINTSGKKECNRKDAVKSCYNLGYYYQFSGLYKEALKYYNQSILTANAYQDPVLTMYSINAKAKKGFIYFQIGDYQKVVEETTLALDEVSNTWNVSFTVDLLNQRALAYAILQLSKEALADVNRASLLINKNDYAVIANYYKTQAFINEKIGRYKEAFLYFRKTIENRKKTFDAASLAKDYLDAGNFFWNNEDYIQAISYQREALYLATCLGDNGLTGKVLNSLANIFYRQKDFANALKNYHKSLLQSVLHFKNSVVLTNPSYEQCKATGDKNFLSLLLENKAECMLQLYKQQNNKKYLDASIETALLADSVITDMRHEQTGQLSKLYWRKETRFFFTNAIEACYEAGDIKRAFYFMEKSRAVLLNDKLNELGASAYLPPKEAAIEDSLRLNLLSKQLQLTKLPDNDPDYKDYQADLLHAKEDFERYIKDLQDKYPAYYQYKYADYVYPLDTLQQYLVKNQQNFVHYFIGDTAIYMLAITPSSYRFIKVPAKNFDSVLSNFLKICSDRDALDNNYSAFARLGNTIYKTLFEPLRLPAGRVIICHDNYLIPFEALTSDPYGENFLVQDYAFSYIYSARFLLKKFNSSRGKGNFLGIAPVNYNANLNVYPLKQSAIYLKESAVHYSQKELITNKEANRKNFLEKLPYYTIVNIYSHARADNSDAEPLLYMNDSVVRLSDLQFLGKKNKDEGPLLNPSTKLVVLSACQTNVGKNATGEGILSLARGFASAGIPSVAATLWKADEQSIYNITEMFHENLVAGMRKDDALQQAKLAFMKKADKKELLPFYWANIILAGNGESITLLKKDEMQNNRFGWIAGIILLPVVLFYLLFFYRKSAI